MKKLLLLAVFGALVSGLQAQMSTYRSEKTTGVAAHEFGASATVINLTQGVKLDSLWIDKNGTSADALTGTPTTRRNNIEIGFEFPFAGKTMNYCGLTAGGMVFFGEIDSLAPAVNIKSQGYTYASDYVQFLLSCYKEKSGNSNSWLATPLTAGENACMRYEKVQDTFFIAYENLQAVDKFGNVLSVSFQYVFDKNGKLSFRPVSMEPQAAHDASTGAYYWVYSWGLVGKTTPATQDLLYIKADGTSQKARVYMDITQASHPVAGESYSFFPPEPCAAVASPQVNWDYDVQADAVILNPTRSMTWNEEASAALFILSQKSTLEGVDLPVNGTTYANGSTLGSSVFVTTGKYNASTGGNYFQKGEASGLTPDTRYYLYAFPYVADNCSGGPIYNTTSIPSQSFRTSLSEPTSLRVDELTDTSVALQINIEGHYLLAFDTLQLPQQTNMKLDETRTYAAGDKIAFGERSLTVIEPYASDPVYTWKGLQSGKDYYCYAWTVSEGKDKYSSKAASCGVAPVRTLPATMGFASADAVDHRAESWLLPAGWDEESGNTYPYVLRYDTAFQRKLLSVRRTLSLYEEVSRGAILSPYVSMGEAESVMAMIELVYWAQSGNEMVVSEPKTGDRVIVEYLGPDNQWSEIARVEKVAVQQDGTYVLRTESFTPKELFRLRFTVISSAPNPDMESEDRSIPYVGIRSLSFEAASCKAVSNLQVKDGSLSSSGAVALEWKDGNAVAALEYSVLYKEAQQTSWSVYPVTVPRVQLTGLQKGGSYTAMVRAYCTDEDSALSQRITFTIPSCETATLVRASHILSTSVDISWKGNGLSYAVVYKPREGDVPAETVYTEQTTLSLTGLTPGTPYEVYVISYCGENHTMPSEPSASAYFNTTVACSAPELTVVEGSVTWQGATLVLKAPVPDRQVRIIPKDEACPVEEYILNTSKDTLNPYGLIDCENITYIAMARSLCTVDTSAWSEPVEFTTLPKPVCGKPSDLQARVNAGGRTATVSWTAGENNLSWLLMHKEKDVQRYDSLPNVRESSVTLYGLKPNTVYTWRVQASCDRQYLYSDLVYGEFSTADVSLAPGKFADMLKLRVDRNQIEIENKDGLYIKTLEVISMEGKRLHTYTINSADNVLIPHTLPMGPAVFRLTGGEGQTAVYKLMAR